MATLYVHHKVADYGKWRAVFDELLGLRQKFGETGERVLHATGEPNEIVAIIEFGNAEQARAWATAPELKEGMKRAGVITQPEVLILEEADSPQHIVMQVLNAIEAQDFAAARALLSDDFRFSGAVPEPISADAWLGVHRALAAAMPDFSFHYIPTGGSGSTAEGVVQVGGTHKGEFAPPVPGLPKVPATNKAILNPKEPVVATAGDGKLTSYVVEEVRDGGLVGILMQMGVTPQHA